MDLHEGDITDYLEYLETGENIIPTPAPVIPPWERKKHWGMWSPFVREYHNIIDNPKRLPTVLQPLLSKERAFTFGREHPSYINYKLTVSDDYGVERKLYVNLCKENLLVGAVGAVLVGVGTKHFSLSQNRLHSFLAQRLLLGRPVSASTKTALSASIIGVALCAKLLVRAVSGGLLYDVLKRSQEDRHTDKSKSIIHAGLAGGISGLVFGLRGGLPSAWAAAILTAGGSIASELVTMPKLLSAKESQ